MAFERAFLLTIEPLGPFGDAERRFGSVGAGRSQREVGAASWTPPRRVDVRGAPPPPIWNLLVNVSTAWDQRLPFANGFLQFGDVGAA